MQKEETLVIFARSCIGLSVYRLKSLTEQAPAEVDCSSFVQWVFSNVDVCLPRLAYEQFHSCHTYRPASYAKVGDLIFKGGSSQSYYDRCPVLGIDHVGIVTTKCTVIHATSSRRGVVEDTIQAFCNPSERGSSLVCCGAIL